MHQKLLSTKLSLQIQQFLATKLQYRFPVPAPVPDKRLDLDNPVDAVKYIMHYWTDRDLRKQQVPVERKKQLVRFVIEKVNENTQRQPLARVLEQHEILAHTKTKRREVISTWWERLKRTIKIIKKA